MSLEFDMKYKRIIIIILLCILFIPIPLGQYRDGGTKVYGSLTYKIVKWNRLLPVENNVERIDMYTKTSIYLLPNNFKSIDELWELEYLD